jgi:hypothetical protein
VVEELLEEGGRVGRHARGLAQVKVVHLRRRDDRLRDRLRVLDLDRRLDVFAVHLVQRRVVALILVQHDLPVATVHLHRLRAVRAWVGVARMRSVAVVVGALLRILVSLAVLAVVIFRQIRTYVVPKLVVVPAEPRNEVGAGARETRDAEVRNARVRAKGKTHSSSIL